MARAVAGKLTLSEGAEMNEQTILRDGTREEVIKWLQGNDPNGSYSDDDALAEGWNPMTLEQARESMRGQLEW